MVRTWFGWSRVARQAGVVPAVVALGLVPLAVVGEPGVERAAAEELPGFSDCAQLRSWYAQAALPHVTPWGLGPRPIFAIPLAATARSGVVAGVEDSASFETVGNGETGTNVQEAGVDEPDLAKTDGARVVLVDGDVLRVVDVTGAEPVEVGSLALPAGSRANELLLVGDRAVLFGSDGGGWRPYDDVILGGPIARSMPHVPPHPLEPTTTVTTVDLSDPAAPSVVHTEQVEGELVSAREHDGVVRVVITHTPELRFVTPTRARSRPEALAANRELVRTATAEDWLPSRLFDGSGGGDGGELSEPLLECADVRHPRGQAGLGTIAVLTLDPQLPADVRSTGVTADGERVYASTDRLYVATTDHGWSPWRGPGPVEREGVERARPRGPVTQVHAFDLDGLETSYVASGTVTGLVHNRWAFSEHEGRLRVATMRGAPWNPSDSAVSVLEERAGKLVVVGQVGGMGVGEEIRAVRWFGDVAVVVTFRQTDPLYTLDLSTPTAPRVVGELKIPGFSAYLHPVGGDLLLGVGQDATLRGRETGAQVSAFDLGDLAAPRRVDTAALGRHSYSPVENESRAFTYLPAQRLALVPVSSWGWGGGARLVVVRVGTDGALEPIATLPLAGRVSSVRALPVDGERVAIVVAGEVVKISTVDRLGGFGLS